MPIPARVNLNPSEEALLACDVLYNTIDTLIVADGFTGNNIMKPRDQSTLFWDWAIVKIGRHSIPAPTHGISDTESVLFDHMDRPVQMDNAECACVTAYFYLDMLFRIAYNWEKIEHRLSFIHAAALSPGIEWAQNLSSADRSTIMTALRQKMSDKGHQVLN
jgi:hypothetical protein